MDFLLIPLIPIFFTVLLCLLARSLEKRKAPRLKPVIAPEYMPPEELSVTEIGVLLDNKLDSFDIGAELYDLMLKKIVVRDKDNLILVADRGKIDKLPFIQKMLLSCFYEDFRRDRVKLDALVSSSKNHLMDFKKKVYDHLTKNKYYPSSPLEQRKTYFNVAYTLITFALLTIIFNLSFLRFSFDLWIVSWFVCGLIVAFFAEKVAHRSAKGNRLYERILGFKLFLETAEKDRIRYIILHEPEHYTRILPFAYLFGLIERWQIRKNDASSILSRNEVKDLRLFLNGNLAHNELSESFTRQGALLWFGRFIISFLITFVNFWMITIHEKVPKKKPGKVRKVK